MQVFTMWAFAIVISIVSLIVGVRYDMRRMEEPHQSKSTKHWVWKVFNQKG